MSVTLTIDLDNTASPALAQWRAGLADGQALHEAMGFAVGAAGRDHLETAGYVGRVNALGGQSTGFWKSVSESINSTATDGEATITYGQRGVALRYYGGEVKPTTRKALSIPVHKSAHGLNASEYPDKLAFIPATTQFGPFRSGGGQDTIGYLVRGVEKEITRGKNKGQTRIVPLARPAGEMIYVLRRRTYHEPDPNILPDEAAIITTATEAAGAYLDSL